MTVRILEKCHPEIVIVHGRNEVQQRGERSPSVLQGPHQGDLSDAIQLTLHGALIPFERTRNSEQSAHRSIESDRGGVRRAAQGIHFGEAQSALSIAMDQSDLRSKPYAE
jgi:hypothetical protein